MQTLAVFVVLAFLAGGSKTGSTASPRTVTQVPAPEVYLYGNAIPGPYRAERVGATVRLNGIQVYPLLAATESADSKPTEVQPTEAQSKKHDFMQEGWALKRKLEQEGKCCGELAGALAEFYRSRTDLVADVSKLGENSFWVKWVDGGEEEILTSPSSKLPSPEERAQQELKLIQEMLDMGCIIIMSSTGSVTVPPNDLDRLAAVRAEIAAARRTPVDSFGSKYNANNQWKGKYLPPDIARQFASPRKLATAGEE